MAVPYDNNNTRVPSKSNYTINTIIIFKDRPVFFKNPVSYKIRYRYKFFFLQMCVGVGVLCTFYLIQNTYRRIR